MPKEGEIPTNNETKFKGEDWTYCSKCRGNKGTWFKKGSEKAHKTDQHSDSNQLNVLGEPIGLEIALPSVKVVEAKQSPETQVHEQQDEVMSLGTVNEIDPEEGHLSQKERDFMDQIGRLYLCQEILDEVDSENFCRPCNDEYEQDWLYNAQEASEGEECKSIKEYIEEMKEVNETIPDLTERQEYDDDSSSDEESDNESIWRKKLSKSSSTNIKKDPPGKRVSFNEDENEVKEFVPSKW